MHRSLAHSNLARSHNFGVSDGEQGGLLSLLVFFGKRFSIKENPFSSPTPLIALD